MMCHRDTEVSFRNGVFSSFFLDRSLFCCLLSFPLLPPSLIANYGKGRKKGGGKGGLGGWKDAKVVSGKRKEN